MIIIITITILCKLHTHLHPHTIQRRDHYDDDEILKFSTQGCFINFGNFQIQCIVLLNQMSMYLLARRTRSILSTPGWSISGRRGSSATSTAASGGEARVTSVHKTWPVTTSRNPGFPSTSGPFTPSLWAWTRLWPSTAGRSVLFHAR